MLVVIYKKNDFLFVLLNVRQMPPQKGKEMLENVIDRTRTLGLDESMGYTVGQCQICLEDVTDNDIVSCNAYACSENHCVDTHCLAHQVSALEIHSCDQVNELKIHGLSCCGDGGKCKERIALDTVKTLLEPTDWKALDQRLTKIEKSVKSGLDAQAEREITIISHGIEKAFNICCPAIGCGGFLDKIEGCSAAICQDKTCKTMFCYLCLKQQANSEASHAHAREHSENYWEMRPGFTERYHWQISRKELVVTFKGRLDPKVRKAALEFHKSLLEEKNMWPMPAGMKTSDWIESVQNTLQSSRKYYKFTNNGKKREEKTEALHTKAKKIELFQNEYIYLNREGAKKNADLVKVVLQGMGGAVFVSLDVRDAGRPQPAAIAVRQAEGGQRVQPVQPAVAVRQNGRMLVGGRWQRAQPEQVAAIAVRQAEGGQRVQPVAVAVGQLELVLGADQVQSFVQLGPQYRVGNLIWSSTFNYQTQEGDRQYLFMK
jgi:hypothetical protein